MTGVLLFASLLAAGPMAAQGDAKRGQYLATAGGCMGCHTMTGKDAAAYAGGRALKTPFGTFYGKPITIDNSAGNLVAFGDIAQAYIIRRVRGVQLLVDPYSAQKKRAVQYHAWARADANIQDPNAVSVSSWSAVNADT